MTVRIASSAADVTAYAGIAGKAFTHLSMPEDLTATAIDNPDVWLASRLRDRTGRGRRRAGSRGVGRTVRLRTRRLRRLGCVPRRGEGRGLGDVVTRAVTNEAFDRGASVVTLEASKFGESTYARMEYREIYRYRLLIRFET